MAKERRIQTMSLLLLLILSINSFTWFSDDLAANLNIKVGNLTISVTVYTKNPGGMWWIHKGDNGYFGNLYGEEPGTIIAYGYFPTCNEQALIESRWMFPPPYCGCKQIQTAW